MTNEKAGYGSGKSLLTSVSGGGNNYASFDTGSETRWSLFFHGNHKYRFNKLTGKYSVRANGEFEITGTGPEGSVFSKVCKIVKISKMTQQWVCYGVHLKRLSPFLRIWASLQIASRFPCSLKSIHIRHKNVASLVCTGAKSHFLKWFLHKTCTKLRKRLRARKQRKMKPIKTSRTKLISIQPWYGKRHRFLVCCHEFLTDVFLCWFCTSNTVCTNSNV